MLEVIQSILGIKTSHNKSKKTLAEDGIKAGRGIEPTLPSERKVSNSIGPHFNSSNSSNQKNEKKIKCNPIRDTSLVDGDEELDVSRYIVDVSGFSWEDIAGMEAVKQELKEVVALLKPDKDVLEAIEHFKIETLKGLLMFGPPGCGKTLIAKALASECDATFYLINGPEIKTKWVGESAKILRKVYRDAQKNEPAIIFIDEIDSICMSRDCSAISETTRDIVNTLLPLLDGMKDIEGVFTIGATNRPELLDNAILRPGRLGKGVHVHLPDQEARRAILTNKYAKLPLAKDVNLEEIVVKTNGYSGADIAGMVSDSARIAWRRNSHKADGEIILEDIEEALKKGPSISQECVAGNKRWEQYAFE